MLKKFLNGIYYLALSVNGSGVTLNYADDECWLIAVIHLNKNI